MGSTGTKEEPLKTFNGLLANHSIIILDDLRPKVQQAYNKLHKIPRGCADGIDEEFYRSDQKLNSFIHKLIDSGKRNIKVIGCPECTQKTNRCDSATDKIFFQLKNTNFDEEHTIKIGLMLKESKDKQKPVSTILVCSFCLL